MILREMLLSCDILGIQGNPNIDITGVEIDSRRVKSGDLFICIPGTRVDGHTFAKQALDNGAAALVVDHFLPGTMATQICVEDPRLAIAQCSAALWNHPAKTLKMIAVTGTNGKTTTTHFIKHVLEFAGAKVGMMGTVSNYIGDVKLPQILTTPDPPQLHTLLASMRDAGCEYAILEASAHALALRKLEGIRFSISVFTNLSQDHLDDFHTMEAYTEAKHLLFADTRTETAVIHGNDPASTLMVKGRTKPVLTYGRRPNENIWADNIYEGLEGVRYTLHYGTHVAEIRMQIGGSFNVENSMAAAAVCLQLGLPLETVAQGLSTAPSVPGRIEKVSLDAPFTVVVDYAHSPDSLRSILQTLRPITNNRLICVYGCGGNRDQTKRPIMGEIAAENCDFAIITSDNPRWESPEGIIDMIEAGARKHPTPYIRMTDRRNAICYALQMAQEGDTVLIAGKGHENYQEIQGVKHPFDDVSVVKEQMYQ